jgi:O-antigen ligase
MSSSAKRRSSSSWPAGGGTSTSTGGGLGEFVSAVLLIVILSTGALILGGVRLWTHLPLLVLVSILLLIQGVRLAAKPSPGAHRRVDVIDLSVILFLLYAVARWLTSPTEYFSRIEVMQVAACAVVFLTCRHGLRSRTTGLVFLFLLVGLGVFQAGFGYYLHLNPDWFPFGPTERLQLHYAPRWIGTYGNPNHYASFLIMASGAALALGCFSKLPWPARIILFYVTGMMLIGVMNSGSRGGWISAVAATLGLTIFALRNRTVRWWLPVAGAAGLLLAAGILFSLSPEVQDRVADIEDRVHAGLFDIDVRVELARDALHIARDHPVFGTGPGTFTFVHPRYQSSTFAYKAVLTHDDYLNCLDDYGVIGFGLALVFVIAVTRKWFTPLRSSSRWQDRVVVAAGFAAWSALLVHSLFDFNLHVTANAFMLFALAGLGLGRLSRDEEAPAGSTVPLAPLGRSLGWALMLLSLLYGFEAVRTALSDLAFEHAFADALDAPAEQSIREAEEALRYDPGNAQDLVFLGDLYRYQASQQDDIEDRIGLGQKALDAYQRAFLANTIDDNIQARQAMTYDVMRRYTEAFLNYKEAVEAEPYNGEYWYWLGNHYWQRGMLAKAEEAYLLSQKCPHGGEASVQAEQDLRGLPTMQDVPLPAPGANPLTPQPVPVVGEHPPTTP